MLSIEAITDFKAFRGIEPAWNGVLKKSGADNPFMTIEWFSCWWKSYGGDARMLVLLVKEDDETVAIAPLMRRKMKWRGLPVRAVTFMANYTTPRTGFLLSREDPRFVSFILGYLTTSAVPHDILQLDYIERGSPTDRLLRETFSAESIRYSEKPAQSSPYIAVSGSWEEYFKSLPKKFRSRTKNIDNGFSRRAYEIIRYSGENIDRGMEEILAISRRTWKYRTRTAIVSSDTDTEFYRLLAREAAPRGWIDLWVLKLEGKPVAFTYNLNHKKKVFGVKSGYDENYGSLAPSRFLNNHTIKVSFEEQAVEYDLLGKNDPYKMKWASKSRDHCRFIVFSAAPYGALLHLVETKAVPVVKRLFAAVGKDPAAIETAAGGNREEQV